MIVRRTSYCAWFLGLAMLSALAGCGSRTHVQTDTLPHPVKKTPPKFADLVAEVRSGIVRIEADTCTGEAVGTGFLLSARSVATVQHVVSRATRIVLKRNGRVLGTASVIGSDAARDLALLRAHRPIRGYHFAFSRRPPRLGDEVAVLGFPLGLPLSVDRGLVSGLNRTIPIANVERTRLIQTDAAVNRGNSGGPLLALPEGKVLGLIDLGTTEANGIAFAVNSRVAQPLLQAWTVAPQPIEAAVCAPASPPVITVAAPPPTPPPLSLTTFSGQYFSVDYPDSWRIETAERSQGSYLDTTIRDPADSSFMIRVDVSPGANSNDPIVASRPVVSALRRESGYREIDFSRIDFEGYDAVHWEFVVPESGVLLHKEDVIFTSSSGDDVAILTQAPDASYAGYAPTFSSIFQSLTVY